VTTCLRPRVRWYRTDELHLPHGRHRIGVQKELQIPCHDTMQIHWCHLGQECLCRVAYKWASGGRVLKPCQSSMFQSCVRLSTKAVCQPAYQPVAYCQQCIDSSTNIGSPSTQLRFPWANAEDPRNRGHEARHSAPGSGQLPRALPEKHEYCQLVN
jgi:hypothetical protein